MDDATREQLKTLDKSLYYMLVIIAAVFLSYYAIILQKKQLLCAPQDEAYCFPDSLQFRRGSSVLVVAALIFFFSLSLQAQNTPSLTCKQEKSRNINFISSILVLAAAVLRFSDVVVLQE